jgi:hypothetical protein
MRDATPIAEAFDLREIALFYFITGERSIEID